MSASSTTIVRPEAPPPLSRAPDDRGRFGTFGGRYVPETLVAALDALEAAYAKACGEPAFWDELSAILKDFVGRATPLHKARGLTALARGRAQRDMGATIWLKREDLCHTGAHKINNTMGQGLLAVRMGSRRIIAETGAGQHGVAAATAAAYFGLKCEVYMGAEDVRRQALNVSRMRMLGATVHEVTDGSRTLKDATNAALRDWMGSSEHTHYMLGSVVGPHPFPMMVRDFQSIIGRETMAQSLRLLGKLPECIVACVGGGSNAAGMFFPFIDDKRVKLVGVEAGGSGPGAGQHAASLCAGSPGVLHGAMTYVLQDGEGQTSGAHSCSAGLDYPGVGPEHAFWKEQARVSYVVCTDDEALRAFGEVAACEGILPALESSHAVAEALRLAPTMKASENLVVCLSGRGDKDVDEVTRLLAVAGGGR
ncbi:MAG: tryptophan synthase subunit beta [Leptolyngbya sp. PLA1]|nr:tryptophan synthase subunit beta [Leptolyngbya sp. PLA1]